MRSRHAPRSQILIVSAALLGLGACRESQAEQPPAHKAPAAAAPAAPAAPAPGAKLATATFAGGCFWCMEPPFEKLPGVVSVTSGFSGGQKKDPTYDEVSGGGTGHAETVQIVYDPAKVSYEKLLEVFWHNIDPTTPDRQFCDVGNQYRSAIFYHDATQKRLAEESRRKLEQGKVLKAPIVTQLVPYAQFYAAEEYHQDFYKKNPARYYSYRSGCGRDARLKELWGAAPH